MRGDRLRSEMSMDSDDLLMLELRPFDENEYIPDPNVDEEEWLFAAGYKEENNRNMSLEKKDKIQSKITDWFPPLVTANRRNKHTRKKTKSSSNYEKFSLKNSAKKRHFQSKISTWMIAMPRFNSNRYKRVSSKIRSSSSINYRQQKITKWTITGVQHIADTPSRLNLSRTEERDTPRNISIDSEIERHFVNNPTFNGDDSIQTLVENDSSTVADMDVATYNHEHFSRIDNFHKLNEEATPIISNEEVKFRRLEPNRESDFESNNEKIIADVTHKPGKNIRKGKKKRYKKRHYYREENGKLVKYLKEKYKRKQAADQYEDEFWQNEKNKRERRKKNKIRKLLEKYLSSRPEK